VNGTDLPLGGILPASPELVQQEIIGASYLLLDETVPMVRQAFAIFDVMFG